jgi:predicted nucleotidyltransferase
MVGTGDRTVEEVSIDGIRDTLARTELVFAVLFGSCARDTAGESSDVDIALRFPDEMGARERFRLRNRLDAELQRYAEDFVDVSDIDALPTSVAYAALREGDLLVGEESTVKAYRKRISQEYEATADERERERRDLIERLAAGDV